MHRNGLLSHAAARIIEGLKKNRAATNILARFKIVSPSDRSAANAA